MTTAPDIDLDIELITEVDELDQLPCVDRNHPKGVSFHDADAPAEFVIISPCCGDRGLLCRKRARYLRDVAATIHCMNCDRRWPPTRYQFIPLPGAMPL